MAANTPSSRDLLFCNRLPFCIYIAVSLICLVNRVQAQTTYPQFAPFTQPPPITVPSNLSQVRAWHTGPSPSSVVSLDASLPPPPPGWHPGIIVNDNAQPDQLVPTRSKRRAGFFQRQTSNVRWIPAWEDGIGVTEFQSDLTVALPAPNRESPLLIKPSFRLFALTGPKSIDVPSSVFDTWLEAMWLPKINQHWQAVFSVAPGVYADFDSYQADAFRITGLGLAHYRPKPDELEFYFGVVYLDREDIRLLPAGGVLWIPNDDFRLELFFPKPKLAWRYRWDKRHEDWLYLAGEFGGNSYGVRRESGDKDLLTMRDLRLILGTQRKWDRGTGWKLQVGYVFGRQLSYRSNPTIYRFDPSVLLGAGYIF